MTDNIIEFPTRTKPDDSALRTFAFASATGEITIDWVTVNEYAARWRAGSREPHYGFAAILWMARNEAAS